MFKQRRSQKRKMDTLQRRYVAEALELRLLLSAQMVGDFAPGTPGSNPSQMINFNGELFFIADDGVHGSELWKSNGTQAGTTLVKDIQPGPIGALKRSWLTNFNNAVYFAADDGINGRELWKTDGTEAGTMMVADIYPGAASSDPGATGVDDRTHLVIGNTMYFEAVDDKGSELWKTDGTRKGTVLVKDINTGTNALGGSYPAQMTSVNGLLIFAAYTGSKRTLYRSDGTAAGTFSLDNATQKVTDPGQMTVLGGYVYFVSSNINSPTTLYRSDGTVAGTTLVSGSGGQISELTRVNNDLYCVVFQYTGNSYDLSKLNWATSQIETVMPSKGTAPLLVRNLTSLNDKIYFKARGNSNPWALWQSDGTPAGTVIVKDITPDAPADGAYDPYGNGFIFYGTDATGAEGLWKSDGTTAGTTLIRAMDLPQADYQNVGTALAIGQTFYFSANTGIDGIELWKTDGTDAGTVLVRDINTDGFDFNPTFGAEFNALLYFAGSGGDVFWRSDGTYAGTTPTAGGIRPIDFVSTGNDLFYAGIQSGSSGRSLWSVSNGWLQTQMGGEGTYDITNLNGTVFFTGITSHDNYFTLWESDGTPGGTVSLGGQAHLPRNLTVMGNKLYFTATGDGTGTELWRSDGTPGGTILLKDVLTGAASSNPRSLTVAANTLYFLADGLQGATALWKSDGTPQGTQMVVSLNDALASDLIAANGLLFFLRSDPVSGRELWESDGTTSGTKMVKDIVPGPGSSKISHLLAVGDTLYFQANDVVHGAELWKSDGSEAGTQMVADVFPGLTGSNALPGFDANGLLIFTANDPAHGTELWGSDGTAAGTTLLADINPGPASSDPTGYAMADGVLYFAANDGVHGNELWKYPDIPQRLRAQTDGPHSVFEGQNVPLSSFGSTGDIDTKATDVLLKPQKRSTLFSDYQITPIARPVRKAPPARPGYASR